MNMLTEPKVERSAEQEVRVSYRQDRSYLRLKRTLDIFIASIALIVAAPVLAIATLAIWLEDRNHPIFIQRRVGQFGRTFPIFKLRTMSAGSCRDAMAPSRPGDSRVTRVGSTLRKLSIDELPQLLNVLRGDMALVGPRPEMPFIVETYQPWQRCRHLCKPGITGLWQVSVRKRIPLSDPEASRIDLEYLRRASIWTDGWILIRTISALVDPRGAY